MFLRVFSILPPAACYLLAGVAFFSTYYVYEGYFAEQKAMNDALALPAPQAIPIDRYRGETTEFGEVAFVAQIRGEWTQTLRAGAESRVVSFLVAPGASELGTEALGAISLTAEKMTDFVAWLETSATAPSPLGEVYEMNGRIVSPQESDAVKAALDAAGIRVSENFVLVEPFLNGREAALTPPPLNYSGYVAGGIIVLLLTFVGYQRSVEDRASRRPRVTSTEVMSKLTPMATGMADPDLALVAPRRVSKADPDSPLGRIQARSQSEGLES